MNMSAVQRKPKLVFFQWDHQPNADAAGYLLLHMQQHVKCLATHFDVVVVNQDCDYAEICDRHEPDLALFESGYRSHGSRRTKIINTAAHPGVPKLGLHNGDPWCDRRAGFLSDMEQWGIETFFSIATLMPHYTSALGENLFVWPNFIDPALFHDYGQHKTIPVTLTGQVYGLYPWRQQVFPLIRDRYPCLVSPHYDYASRQSSTMLTGQAYARALNASFVVPTCGTEAGEAVRKHFEIPGAKACLVTERTDALTQAGFVDGENCVFADHRDVVERLEHLFSHPDELQRITEAGYELVHTRHTLKHRPQIYQWLMLHRRLRPGEKIIQLGPFGDLATVDRDSGRKSIHVAGSARDRMLLKEGDLHMQHGRIEAAMRCYAQCLDYVSYLPEAKFRLALCALHQGDADRACALIAGLIEITTLDYGATDPDPVEWAWFLLALIGKGELEKARSVRDFYPRLSHEELTRTRKVIDRLSDGVQSGFGRPDRPGRARKSIHQFESRSDGEWLAALADMLDRCGQLGFAARLRNPTPCADLLRSSPRRAKSRARETWKARSLVAMDRLAILLRLEPLRPNVPPIPEFRYGGHLARGIARSLFKGRLRPVGRALSMLLKKPAPALIADRGGTPATPADIAR
jgi:hypothetical protein